RDLYRSDHKKLGKSTVNKRKPATIGAAKTCNARIPQPLNGSIRFSLWPHMNADFRGAKLTHIPHRQPQRFSRNVDTFCEVIFHLRGPRATPLLRGHHLLIASRGLAELPAGACNGSPQCPGATGKIPHTGAFEYQ